MPSSRERLNGIIGRGHDLRLQSKVINYMYITLSMPDHVAVLHLNMLVIFIVRAYTNLLECLILLVSVFVCINK